MVLSKDVRTLPFSTESLSDSQRWFGESVAHPLSETWAGVVHGSLPFSHVPFYLFSRLPLLPGINLPCPLSGYEGR